MKKMYFSSRRWLYATLFMLQLLWVVSAGAQNNVGINPTGALPDPSAALDVVASDKGMLIPRMSAVQRIAIAAPADGLLVYDTDTMCVMVYRAPSADWLSLCSGSAGGNGHNTLALTTVEPAGANCTYGGVKLDFGVDMNDNGILDAGEILGTLTRYVCNGAPGAAGAQGPQGPAGAAGAQGPQGPAGAAGAQGPQGPQGPAGTGFNTVALTTPEPAGVNCANGGVLLQFGLDANNNGVLDAGEINPALSRYVCNGAAGAAGAQGPQGPAGAAGAQGPQGPAGAAGAQGPQGPQGPAGPVGCATANYVIKSDGASAVCSQIYDNGTNVGIGTAAPTQKLDIVGAVKFSNALMPNNNAGLTGQLLKSQGAGVAPIWSYAETIVRSVTGSSDASILTTTWTDMPQMTLTFTPVKSTAYISFTCSGYGNMAGQEIAYARIVKDGVPIIGTNTIISETDDWGDIITSWNLAINYPITVTPGVATTIKIQWRTYQGVATLYNNVVSDPDKTCHRTLFIYE